MTWTPQDARNALAGSDLLELGMEADQVRRALHPEGVVTYALTAPGKLMLAEAARRECAQGDSSVVLASVTDIGDLSPDDLVGRLSKVRNDLPGVTFHQLALSQLASAAGSDAQVADLLARLHAAGLRSLGPSLQSGPDAMLSGAATPSMDAMRRILSAASRLDIAVSLALTIGAGEPLSERVRSLAVLRELQQTTTAIAAVVVRIHHAATAEARREEEATAVDYLKTLAVTRIFLDTVPHVQTEWSVMGPKVLELALRFGADDAGAVTWSQAGSPEPSHHGGESELRRIIRDAGFRPVLRDALFRQSLLR